MDDVLERAKRNIEELDFLKPCTDIRGTIVALAAEVRALRKDRERLDFVLEHYAVEIPNGTHGDFPRWLECREDIDAAMASRGEDS